MAGLKKILIADDEKINRRMLKIIFGDKYEILEAENGEQAIEMLDARKGDIDLLLLDINMPLKNGFQVLEHLKAEKLLVHIPVIVITADRDPDTELRVYDCGAADIVRKPFVPEIIQHKSETLIDLYSGRRELALQLEENREQLKKPKEYDELTGLFNRQKFFSLADEILQNSDEDTCKEYAVIYGNIHNFKYFNIKHGIKSGDDILIKMAAIIQEIAEGELSARFDGDHFVTITKNPAMMKWLNEVNRRFECHFGNTGMQMKIGIYHVRNAGEAASAACEFAKLACDSICHTGESICEYTEKLGQKIELDTYVIQHIDEAIRNHYIQVYYQPVIRTISGKTCGMEALARWDDPEKGFLSPIDFIPALEANHQITKLDLYMLREICAGIREVSAQGRVTVPISFNLSRIDFLQCDIFKEVEKIVAEYGVPRDMINIEVTESTVTNDPELLRREIQRFREGGYQVWMDDFGSGYSSLNVLKDYQFDEIKLDMKFLSSLDDSSKTIIESTVLMAKKMGIQTLAEGVETQEQFDFLREIGCEKVQGYLFSKPLSTEDIEKISLTTRPNMEQRAWKSYYNQIGTFNFITDRPVAIIEYDGKDVMFRCINQSFRNVLKSIGATNMEMVLENINSPYSELAKQFRSLYDICHVGDGVSEMIYSVRGYYVRLNVRCLAEQEHMSAYEIEICKMNPASADKKSEEIDRVYRLVHASHDLILTVDLATGKTSIIKYGNQNADRRMSVQQSKTSVEVIGNIFDLIHPDDRKAFLEFTDGSTVTQRVEAAKSELLSGFFRIRSDNGAYVWKLHTLLYLPESNSIIYCNRYAPVDDQKLVEWTFSEYGTSRQEDPEQRHLEKAIYKGLMESKNVNVFWKDTDRRFIGANERFLRTYGFDDVSAILGKNDEDMGWHIEEKIFAEDEHRVLEKGEVITNRFCQCIIQGVVHNIIASKEPLYENGKIVGLLGFFMKVDDLKEDMRTLPAIRVEDSITGLMSPNGLTNTFAQYVDEWLIKQKKFAVIHIEIKEYFRAMQNYGEEIANAMLREVAQIILGLVGNRGSCARAYIGNFLVLMRYEERAEVEQIAEDIRVKLDNIHFLSKQWATVHPVIRIVYGEDKENMISLMGFNAESALLESAMQKSEETRLEYVWNTYEELSEKIYAADMDTYELLYMNRSSREACGVSSMDQLKGKKCYEVILGKASPCEFCTNKYLVNQKPHEYDFFNSKLNCLFHLREQMLVYNGRRIRIESAAEVIPDNGKVDRDVQRQLMISEGMRVALGQADMNVGIQNLIEYIGQLFDCASTYLLELVEDGTAWSNTCEWCAEGVPPQKPFLQKVRFELTSVWNQELRRDSYIAIRDVHEIKESAPVIYEYLCAIGVHALILAPVYVNHMLYGLFGVNNPPENLMDEISANVKTVSQVISIMLEKRDLLHKLDRMSYIDSFSKIGNRHAVDRFFEEIDCSKSIGVVFCDVCGLKRVNDSMGHQAGDQLLLQVCNMLKSVFGTYSLFRWGGDEMLVLASGISESDFYEGSKRLRDMSVEQCAPLAVGAVWKNQMIKTADELIREADMKMYEHKQSIYNGMDIWTMLVRNENLKDHIQQS